MGVSMIIFSVIFQRILIKLETEMSVKKEDEWLAVYKILRLVKFL
jgi:hypothetical protein